MGAAGGQEGRKRLARHRTQAAKGGTALTTAWRLTDAGTLRYSWSACFGRGEAPRSRRTPAGRAGRVGSRASKVHELTGHRPLLFTLDWIRHRSSASRASGVRVIGSGCRHGQGTRREALISPVRGTGHAVDELCSCDPVDRYVIEASQVQTASQVHRYTHRCPASPPQSIPPPRLQNTPLYRHPGPRPRSWSTTWLLPGLRRESRPLQTSCRDCPGVKWVPFRRPDLPDLPDLPDCSRTQAIRHCSRHPHHFLFHHNLSPYHLPP